MLLLHIPPVHPGAKQPPPKPSHATRLPPTLTTPRQGVGAAVGGAPEGPWPAAAPTTTGAVVAGAAPAVGEQQQPQSGVVVVTGAAAWVAAAGDVGMVRLAVVAAIVVLPRSSSSRSRGRNTN